MGKTKKPDEVFSLKKELRECNETLEKQLALHKKEKNEQKKEKAEKKRAKELEKKSNMCPDCGTGSKVYSDLGIRKITTCSNKCGYKEVVKTNVKEEEF
jgi:ribosomal protein S14